MSDHGIYPILSAPFFFFPLEKIGPEIACTVMVKWEVKTTFVAFICLLHIMNVLRQSGL